MRSPQEKQTITKSGQKDTIVLMRSPQEKQDNTITKSGQKDKQRWTT